MYFKLFFVYLYKYTLFMRNTVLEPNMIFGSWKTISFHSKNEIGGTIGKWKCLCMKCNTEHFVRTADLIGGMSTQCRTCARAENGRKATIPNKGACKTKILLQIKRQASSRNLEMTLTDNEIFELTSQDCFYCGKKPDNKAKSHNGDFILFNGIDRINNNLGYHSNNVVPCCKHCNISKLDLPLNEWVENITRIYNNKHEILKRSETISKESTD